MSKVKIANEKTNLRRGFDHIGVCICFVVHDGKGNMLMQKRSLNCRDEQGRWDVGGGAVEFGELLEDAVTREIQEELSTKPLKIEYLHTYDAHREHEGQKTHWIAIGYAVQVDPEKVKIGEPHKIDDIGWFTTDSLPDPLHSQCHRSFEMAKARGFIA